MRTVKRDPVRFTAEDQELLFFAVGVRARGQGEGVSTIEMVDDVGVTERQLESQETVCITVWETVGIDPIANSLQTL